MYPLRGFIHKEDRHARFPQTVRDACEALREPFAGRHHQIPIPPPEATVLCLRRFQIIKGRNVVGNMRVIADLRGLLGQHSFRVHPLCLSMIKDRPRGLHVRAVQQRCYAVDIVHQQRETGELRIIALRVKVRRAVLVRKLIVKGMGNETVHTPHQQEIHQPRHQRRTLRPAIRTEDLAHGLAIHGFVLAGMGGSQLAQHIVIKLPVRRAALHGGGRDAVRHAGHHLMQHNVNAAHVLPVQAAEIMSRAAAETCVGVHVLNHVPDILHAARTAPVAQLIREVLFPELRHRVHVGKAHLRGAFRVRIPQERQLPQGRCHALPHAGLHRIPPWQLHTRHAYRAVINPRVVADLAHMLRIEARLIGEKARNGLAEKRRVVRIMRLIHRLDQLMHRFPGQHIDIILLRVRAGIGFRDIEHPPQALRHVQIDELVLLFGLQQHRLPGQFLILACAAIHDHRQQLFLRGKMRHQQGNILRGTHHVHMEFPQNSSAQAGIAVRQNAVGIARGEMLVIENPHAHVPLPGFRQNNVHGFPPCVLAEMLIGPRLHAERTTAACIDCLKLRRNLRVVSVMLPEKWQQIIFRPALQHVFQNSVHTFSLFSP